MEVGVGVDTAHRVALGEEEEEEVLGEDLVVGEGVSEEEAVISTTYSLLARTSVTCQPLKRISTLSTQTFRHEAKRPLHSTAKRGR